MAACSSSLTEEFHTRGLVKPKTACSVAPNRLGVAEKLKKFSRRNGCGIERPWKVSSLAGVEFSQAATIDCGVAGSLNDWIKTVAQPAARKHFGEKIASLKIAASYSCRARNNKRGAKLSEHGLGNAIDISAVTLASGREVTILKGWNGRRDERAFLRRVHSEACGKFTTVLGPKADRHHRDHFHFDLANRRNGSVYCR